MTPDFPHTTSPPQSPSVSSTIGNPIMPTPFACVTTSGSAPDSAQPASPAITDTSSYGSAPSWGPRRSSHDVPDHQRVAPRTPRNLPRTATSAFVDPPFTLGEPVQNTYVLPVEVFPGWSPHRRVHMSFTGGSGIKTLCLAEVYRITDSSDGDIANVCAR